MSFRKNLRDSPYIFIKSWDNANRGLSIKFALLIKKLLKMNDFNMTQGISLLLLKPIDLPSNFVLNLIIFITDPKNKIGY